MTGRNLPISLQPAARHLFRHSFAAAQVAPKLRCIGFYFSANSLDHSSSLDRSVCLFWISCISISGDYFPTGSFGICTEYVVPVGKETWPTLRTEKTEFEQISIQWVANISTEIMRHHLPPQLEQSLTPQQVTQKSTTATKRDNRRPENGTENENQPSHDWVAWR